MDSDQINISQAESSENLEARQLTTDNSLSSCPQHPELPLIRLSFDYFPSQPNSSIIRFKCEKCCMLTTNDSGILFRSKWFEFKEFLNYEPSFRTHPSKIDYIAYNQIKENHFEFITDQSVFKELLPIEGNEGCWYNPIHVRNSYRAIWRDYYHPIDQITPYLGQIAFDSNTNLDQKLKQLLPFIDYYQKSINEQIVRLKGVMLFHSQLLSFPELQPPPEVSQDQIEIWLTKLGKERADFLKRTIAQIDVIENFTIDLTDLDQSFDEEAATNMAALLARMVSLKRLNLSVPKGYLRKGYSEIAKGITKATNLISLQLQIQFEESLAAMIGSLKYLQNLKLNILFQMKIRDVHDLTLALSHLSQLKILEISFRQYDQWEQTNRNLYYYLMPAISQQTQLVELNLLIELNDFEDSCFSSFGDMFSKLTSLEKLHLRLDVQVIQSKGINLLIESLIHLQKLNHLRIYLFHFSEVVLRLLNLVIPSLKQLKSLCLTLKDTFEHNNSWEYAKEGNPIELFRLGSNLSQLKNLETLKLFFLSNRFTLKDQEQFAATIIQSTKDSINFSSLKVCLITHINWSYQNILSHQFTNQIQKIEKLTFLNLHFRSNVAIQIFETLARMKHLRHLKIQITQESERESCVSAIQSSIGQLTQLSSFKLTIMDSDLRDMSLVPLVESIKKLQNNLSCFQFQLRKVKWAYLKNGLKQLSRRFKSMRKLTAFIIKFI